MIFISKELFVGILLFQLAITIIGLYYVLKNEKTSLSKFLWSIFVIFFQLIGPIVYFVKMQFDKRNVVA